MEARKIFYTKKALCCFRVISFLCAVLLIFIEVFFKKVSIREILQTGILDFSSFFSNIFNIIVIFLCLFLVLFPTRFGILSFIAFVYSSAIIVFEPLNGMGILMYFLGTALLFARGLMNKKRKLKLIFLCIFLCLLNLTQLRYGFRNFFYYFLITLGYVFVLCFYTFFMSSYHLNTLVYEDKNLNLAKYPKLNERDYRILQKIQSGDKYANIAKDENLSEGSLKNRLHFVFDTLETGDKQGFLSLYSDWNICYIPEDPKTITS